MRNLLTIVTISVVVMVQPLRADLVVFEWVNEMLTEEEAKLKKQAEIFNLAYQIKTKPIAQAQPVKPPPEPPDETELTPEKQAYALTTFVISLAFLVFAGRMAWWLIRDYGSWEDWPWH